MTIAVNPIESSCDHCKRERLKLIKKSLNKFCLLNVKQSFQEVN